MAEDRKKLEGTDIKLTSSNKILTWLDNFWYHHKWKLIIGLFFAIVIVVGVVQMVNKKDPDVDVTIATHTIYYSENVDAIERTLVSLLPSDLNGDGKKTVNTNLYKIYSEDEMKAANEAETDADGYPVIYADPTHNKEQMQQYNSYIMTGQCSVMIISEYLYNDLVSRRTDEILLIPVSEIFGENIPEGTTKDGYGIKLTETGAYKYLDGLRSLPRDSIVCLMRPFVIGGNNASAKYERGVEYFKSIVEFGN